MWLASISFLPSLPSCYYYSHTGQSLTYLTTTFLTVHTTLAPNRCFFPYCCLYVRHTYTHFSSPSPFPISISPAARSARGGGAGRWHGRRCGLSCRVVVVDTRMWDEERNDDRRCMPPPPPPPVLPHPHPPSITTTHTRHTYSPWGTTPHTRESIETSGLSPTT